MGSDDCTEYEKAVRVRSEVSAAPNSSLKVPSSMPETASAMLTTMQTGTPTRFKTFLGARSMSKHRIGFFPW